MKNIILLAGALLWSLTLSAQINLENTYNGNLLMTTKLTDTTTYYYSTSSSVLTLYNLNHSIYKTVTFPFVHNVDSAMIYYVSETLFDLDSEVEYMRIVFFVGLNGEPIAKGNLKIYNEDGTVLFSADTIVVDRFSFLNGVAPMIINSENGTKMIIRKAVSSTSKSTKIYSLVGEIYTALENTVDKNSIKLSNSYPNPTNNLTRIDYVLPEGINRGELIFCDIKGNIVKKFMVDRSFDHLIISISDLSAGTYLYYIQTEHNISECKKIIVQ